MERLTYNESLYIPVNIKTRFEFFDGYGVTEVFSTVIAAAISGFIAFSIYAATGNTTLCILIVLITIAASVMALAKDNSNQSVIDQLRFMVRFLNTQRKYPYHYTNEWLPEDTGAHSAFSPKAKIVRSDYN